MMVIGYGLCLVGYAAAPDIVFLTAFLLLLSFWYFLFPAYNEIEQLCLLKYTLIFNTCRFIKLYR